MDRMDKVNYQVRRELAEVLRDEIDDPAVGMISIMRVQTSKDLHNCNVYVSVFPESQLDYAVVVLKKMSGRIRMLLGARMTMRYTPELAFFAEEVIKESIDVHDKLEELQHATEKIRRSPKKR